MFCHPRFHLYSGKDFKTVSDDTFGEKIAAVIVARSEINEEKLKSWCKENLAPYKIPKVFIEVEEIEKNAMGKINKKTLKDYFFPQL